MTGLNSVVFSLTGPKRLRSALRQKTAALNHLLGALDGPGELQVSIPASVFGGDIFSVMSQQLREALTIQPPPNTTSPIAHRKRALPSPTDPLAQHSSNPFSGIAEWLKQSTLPGEPVNSSLATALASLPLDQTMISKNSEISSLGPQASRLLGIGEDTLRGNAGETPAVPGKNTTESLRTPTTRQAAAEPALVKSLRRYWQINSETHAVNRLNPAQLPTESFSNTVAAAVTQSDQQITPRVWPKSVGREVSAKLRSVTDNVIPSLKSAPLTAPPDRPIQNVFNISVNNQNQHDPNYDDLGERIAQVLHEQALEHGIDVT